MALKVPQLLLMYSICGTGRKGLLEGDGLNQREAPYELLGVEDQGVIVVAGSDCEADHFRRPDRMGPGHVDLRDKYSSLCGVFNLFEPDRPDGAAGIEDGGDADLTG
jgi:hypothetical protein